MVCIKIPRCDTNEKGAIEVTVTSEVQAQAERTQEQEREEKVTSGGGSGRDRARDDGTYARGRTVRGRERCLPAT